MPRHLSHLISKPVSMPFEQRRDAAPHPKEAYSSKRRSFELAANEFLTFLESEGLEVASWTRVPYFDQSEIPADLADFIRVPFHNNIVAVMLKVS